MSDSQFLQAESGSPEQAAGEAAAGMAALTGANGPIPGANPDAGSAAIDACVTLASPVAGALVALTDAVEGSENSNSSHNQKSRFAKMHMPQPLVPMGYSEMKTAAKKAAKWAGKTAQSGTRGASIFIGNRYRSLTERATIASQSLTGGGIHGLKVKENAMKKLVELKKKLDAAKWAMQGMNRYERAEKRLETELKTDKQSAKQAAQKQKRYLNLPVPSSLDGVIAPASRTLVDA